MKIKLNGDEMEELMKPVSGEGGFQSLLRALQEEAVSNNGVLEFNEEIKKRIKRYANEYKHGGWQTRLRKIFGRHFDV